MVGIAWSVTSSGTGGTIRGYMDSYRGFMREGKGEIRHA